MVGVLLALAGCGLFTSDEEREAEIRAEIEAVERRREPVESVGRVEIGRTRNGFVVSAFGVAPTTGFSQPTLVARRGGRLAPDGFVEFDFLALAPDPGLDMPRGAPGARRLRGDRTVPPEALARAGGIRVFGLRNAVTYGFGEGGPAIAQEAAEDAAEAAAEAAAETAAEAVGTQ